jgi:hypothetical protein
MANLLLSGAALITLALCYLSAAGRLPVDTDSTGVAALFIFLTFPRWFAVAAVLRVLLNRGEFQWISACRLTQEVTVYGAHAVLGVSVLSANVAVQTGVAPGESRTVILLLATLVPGLVLVYAAALCNPNWFSFLPEDGLRKSVCAVTAAGVALLAAVAVARFTSVPVAAAGSPAPVELSVTLAEMNALPPGTPVSAYLQYLNGRYPAEVGVSARRHITMRPTYQNELAELLSDPAWSRQVLEFIRTDVPMPSSGLAPAAANAVHNVASQVQETLSRSGVAVNEEFGFECRLSLEISDRFPTQAHLFVEPIRAIQSAVSQHPRAVSMGVRQELREWLQRHSGQILEARARFRNR